MRYHVTVGSRTFEVELGGDGVTVDGKAVEVDFERVGDGPKRTLLLDGASHVFVAKRVGTETWDVHARSRRLRVDVVDDRTRAIREMTGDGAGPTGPRPVVAPMPGMVVRVEVSEGDTVRAGQGVVIVEAMKMENELAAETDGVVKRIHVREGEAVDKDQLLVDLEAIEGEAAD